MFGVNLGMGFPAQCGLTFFFDSRVTRIGSDVSVLPLQNDRGALRIGLNTPIFSILSGTPAFF